MHESQSLLLEMQVCRSRAFLTYAAPMIRDAFGGDGPEWEVDALYRRQIRVRRSFIRVDADEVTYPAHVILRYRLERAMLAGDLHPAALPDAWATGMRELLRVAPDNDREGCLQDIHWYDGNWGYFPTYTLGALIAAQLFEAARRDVPGLMQAIAGGRIGPAARGGRASGSTLRDRCCRRRSWSKPPRGSRSGRRVFERQSARSYQS